MFVIRQHGRDLFVEDNPSTLIGNGWSLITSLYENHTILKELFGLFNQEFPSINTKYQFGIARIDSYSPRLWYIFQFIQ